LNRVHVLVEGQTEEAFVGATLRSHLARVGVYLVPKLIVTRRVVAGPDRKGGVSSWAQIERDLRLLLNDSSVVAVTTLLDYYGLPGDVPGMGSRPSGSPLARVEHVEAAIDAAIGAQRMRAHLLLHEFETLLFSDPVACGNYLDSPMLAAVMAAAVAQCGGAELVNDSVNSAPSKRIIGAHPTYLKTLHGPALAASIGLGPIRSACPHFDAWVDWLEGLGG
jgi:hypothetical protein